MGSWVAVTNLPMRSTENGGVFTTGHGVGTPISTGHGVGTLLVLGMEWEPY